MTIDIFERMKISLTVFYFGLCLKNSTLRQGGSTHAPMRFFSSFFAFFAAFFSLGVMAACFLLSLLLFCSLPMVLAFA